ncbi:hypothetical protein ABK040_015600 [Willaertia magna]
MSGTKSNDGNTKSTTTEREKYGLEHYYWDLKGELSNLPKDFRPRIHDDSDFLEIIAYNSLKYDHLGGPPPHYIRELNRRKGRNSGSPNEIDDEQWSVVLEQNLHPNRALLNPNYAWDISPSASSFMNRIFQFDNFLHFVTVLLHIGLLIPLSSNFLTIKQQLDKNQPKNSIVRYILHLLMKKWFS